MQPSTIEFLVALRDLFLRVPVCPEEAPLSIILELYLFQIGVKPGVLISFGKIDDEATFKADFLKPLQQMLRDGTDVVHLEYNQDFEGEEHHKVWVIDKDKASEVRLDLDREVPVEMWWKILGYPTDFSVKPDTLTITYYLRPCDEFKAIFHPVLPRRLAAGSKVQVTSYLVRGKATKKKRVWVQVERICVTLSELGRPTFRETNLGERMARIGMDVQSGKQASALN